MANKKKKLHPGTARLKDILKQISGEASELEGDLIPQMAIKGRGHVHCYNPSSREFVSVTRGTKVFIIEEENELGKVLIYTYQGHVVEIEAKELIHIGFD
jgi:hypothetical protein